MKVQVRATKAFMLCCALLSSAPVWAQVAPEPEGEAAKRIEFATAYGVNVPAARQNALALLEGAKEHQTRLMVYKVLQVDKSDEVRQAAFRLLCSFVDTDASVAKMATQIFRAEKDTEMKKAMAGMMTGLAFKYEPTDALIDYLSRLRYPNIPDEDDRNRNRNNGNNGGGGGGGFMGGGGVSREQTMKTRKFFEEVLVHVNAIAGTHFKAAWETPAQAKKWWSHDKVRFMKLDAELYKKLNASQEEEAKPIDWGKK